MGAHLTLVFWVVVAVIVGFLAFVITWAQGRLRSRPQRELDAARLKCKHGVNVYALRANRCAVCYAEVREYFERKDPDLSGIANTSAPEVFAAPVDRVEREASPRMSTCVKCGYSQPVDHQWLHDCSAAGASQAGRTIVCGHCGKDSYNGNVLQNIGDIVSPLWRCRDGCTPKDGGQRFVAGQWVRLKDGNLARLKYFDSSGQRWVLDNPDDPVWRFTYEDLIEEPAVPRTGEWWEKNHRCPTHDWYIGALPDGKQVFGPHKVQDGDGTVNEHWIAAAACGCLAPVNFGKGNG